MGKVSKTIKASTCSKATKPRQQTPLLSRQRSIMTIDSCEEITLQTQIHDFFLVKLKKPRLVTPFCQLDPISRTMPGEDVSPAPSDDMKGELQRSDHLQLEYRSLESVSENPKDLVCVPVNMSGKRSMHLDRKGERRRPINTEQLRQRQLYLDVGQRDFAKQQFCSICGMIYVHGVEEDAAEHDRICKEYTHGIYFYNETARIAARPEKESLIYEIRSTDSSALRRKVVDVRIIVDKELGFVCNAQASDSTTTFLYTFNKRIVGFCSVLPLRHAYLLESDSQRSESSRRALMGIHQIWVHSRFRNQGIASALVDAAREKMMYGMVVPANFVAFSSPTDSGILFARRYVRKVSGSSEVLVYDMQHATA